MLGIALTWTTCGKVYNGITDDDTHDDILNLSIVYFPLVLGDWWFVESPPACFRAFLVLPCARFPCCCFGLCDQDEVLSLGQS